MTTADKPTGSITSVDLMVDDVASASRALKRASRLTIITADIKIHGRTRNNTATYETPLKQWLRCLKL